MTFTEVLLLIIAIAISIIAIKITFTFDINKYQEKKQKDIENKIKNTCTHMNIWLENWNTNIQSTFISPPWTISWYCKRCWLVDDGFNQVEEQRRMKYYIDNPKIYKKQEKKFEKLLKKWWFL